MNEAAMCADGERTLKPGLVWPGADLRGADLTDVDLHGAVLTNVRFPAAMDRVNLMDADLTGARGLKVSAIGANFDRANLDEADFSGADFSGASFQNANLAGAILHAARLVGADFTGADLSFADLSGADLSDAALLAASKLHGLYLAGAKGIGIETVDADEWNDDVACNEVTASEPVDDGTIAERLRQRGAGWRSIDLPRDLCCPACNTFDMVEVRDRNQDVDGHYPCDLCGGDGRMTPAALDEALGMERLPCLWCRGTGEVDGFMSSWSCPVCWGTGRMPAWALAVDEVLYRFDRDDRTPSLPSEAASRAVEVTGLAAAGFTLSDLTFNEGCTFTDCDFSGASFSAGSLPRATFIECDLTDADFTKACLPRASFVRCQLAGSRLFEADDLSGVSILFGPNDSQDGSE